MVSDQNTWEWMADTAYNPLNEKSNIHSAIPATANFSRSTAYVPHNVSNLSCQIHCTAPTGASESSQPFRAITPLDYFPINPFNSLCENEQDMPQFSPLSVGDQWQGSITPTTRWNQYIPRSHLDNTMSLEHDDHTPYNTITSVLRCRANMTYPAPPSSMNITNTFMPAPPIPGSTHTIPTRASSTQIVSVYRSDNSTGYCFQCNKPGCTATFSRWHEFARHDNAYHDGSSVVWCPVAGCSRSKREGNKPFPGVRGDKMGEHVRRVHGGKIEGCE